MIVLKEDQNSECRLFDDKTGKYVKNTADNRSEALFCALLKCEAEKPYRHQSYRLHSVSESAKIFHDFLVTSEDSHQVDERLVKKFIDGCDAVWEIKDLKDNVNFQKLVFLVLKDQRNIDTHMNYYKLENLVDKYSYMNDKIFGKKEEFVM